MKILDTNVLLFAANRDHENHKPVVGWLESALNGDEKIGVPWIVLSGFVRIAINPKVFESPLNAVQAFELVDRWLAEPQVQPVYESGGHSRRFRDLLVESGGGSRVSTDAHIAAIALENRATLVSCDNDFRRFRKLKVENPLDS